MLRETCCARICGGYSGAVVGTFKNNALGICSLQSRKAGLAAVSVAAFEVALQLVLVALSRSRDKCDEVASVVVGASADCVVVHLNIIDDVVWQAHESSFDLVLCRILRVLGGQVQSARLADGTGGPFFAKVIRERQ